MTNVEMADYHYAMSVLYTRLAALDERQRVVDSIADEQPAIDAARKLIAEELDKMPAQLDASSIPIPPAQPPV